MDGVWSSRCCVLQLSLCVCIVVLSANVNTSANAYRYPNDDSFEFFRVPEVVANEHREPDQTDLQTPNPKPPVYTTAQVKKRDTGQEASSFQAFVPDIDINLPTESEHRVEDFSDVFKVYASYKPGIGMAGEGAETSHPKTFGRLFSLSDDISSLLADLIVTPPASPSSLPASQRKPYYEEVLEFESAALSSFFLDGMGEAETKSLCLLLWWELAFLCAFASYELVSSSLILLLKHTTQPDRLTKSRWYGTLADAVRLMESGLCVLFALVEGCLLAQLLPGRTLPPPASSSSEEGPTGGAQDDVSPRSLLAHVLLPPARSQPGFLLFLWAAILCSVVNFFLCRGTSKTAERIEQARAQRAALSLGSKSQPVNRVVRGRGRDEQGAVGDSTARAAAGIPPSVSSGNLRIRQTETKKGETVYIVGPRSWISSPAAVPPNAQGGNVPTALPSETPSSSSSSHVQQQEETEKVGGESELRCRKRGGSGCCPSSSSSSSTLDSSFVSNGDRKSSSFHSPVPTDPDNSHSRPPCASSSSFADRNTPSSSSSRSEHAFAPGKEEKIVEVQGATRGNPPSPSPAPSSSFSFLPSTNPSTSGRVPPMWILVHPLKGYRGSRVRLADGDRIKLGTFEAKVSLPSNSDSSVEGTSTSSCSSRTFPSPSPPGLQELGEASAEEIAMWERDEETETEEGREREGGSSQSSCSSSSSPSTSPSAFISTAPPSSPLSPLWTGSVNIPQEETSNQNGTDKPPTPSLSFSSPSNSPTTPTKKSESSCLPPFTVEVPPRNSLRGDTESDGCEPCCRICLCEELDSDASDEDEKEEEEQEDDKAKTRSKNADCSSCVGSEEHGGHCSPSHADASSSRTPVHHLRDSGSPSSSSPSDNTPGTHEEDVGARAEGEEDVEAKAQEKTKEKERERDPLLRVCSCKGSLGAIHLSCLRRWMRTKLRLPGHPEEEGQEGAAAATRPVCFFWPEKTLQCDLCKSHLPKTLKWHDGQTTPLLAPPELPSPYIVLDVLRRDAHPQGHPRGGPAPHPPGLPDGGAPGQVPGAQARGDPPPPNPRAEEGVGVVGHPVAPPEEAAGNAAPLRQGGGDAGQQIPAGRGVGEDGGGERRVVRQRGEAAEGGGGDRETGPGGGIAGRFFISFARKKRVTLGRGSEADAFVGDLSVSRCHAALIAAVAVLPSSSSASGQSHQKTDKEKEKGVRLEGLFLEDARSRLGTFVAARHPIRLREGETAFLQVQQQIVPVRAASRWDPLCPYGPQLYQRSASGAMEQVPWVTLPTRASEGTAKLLTILQLLLAAVTLPVSAGLSCLLFFGWE
uniref:FHA domain-containing protein n=1 Tax=Chromera velia CCMP2878 TaxID=1169474 RepID=A0A0G4H2B8_9ALVE|eukprot:Cvel_5570.t1-p1 / transcript=Cvel_5570.t1 / gene=Cvel_5570 / organism=Chromera_velia_CCMP2878 / gene_product=hypothetical protein / transcript_product=hypothetical protein / location=Cvel_scaffold261:91512-99933(-) / protein_length=1311 / sequence_SO=supercontig / SO=protein_coding / is_pseudo=false